MGEAGVGEAGRDVVGLGEACAEACAGAAVDGETTGLIGCSRAALVGMGIVWKEGSGSRLASMRMR